MGTVEYCKLTKYFWYELLGHNNESNKLSDLNNFNQADEDEGIEGSINENEETTTILVLYFHIESLEPKYLKIRNQGKKFLGFKKF